MTGSARLTEGGVACHETGGDALAHDVEELVEELVVGSDRRMHPASLLLPLVIAGLAVFLLLHREAVRDHLLELRAWSAALGAWGFIGFGALYAVAVVLFIPGNLMTGVSMALFGPLPTIPLVSIAGTAGATAAFLVSRYCVRAHVATRFAGNRRFVWLDEHTARRGALFVAVARVLPILPGNVLHYAFGLTRVDFTTYVFWSWLASLPGLVLFVAGLTTVFRLLTGGTVPLEIVAAFVVVVLVKIVLVAWAAREAGIPLRWRRRGSRSKVSE